jgi:NADPH:quinone reductase-like Zn-dependent oxidoreductase
MSTLRIARTLLLACASTLALATATLTLSTAARGASLPQTMKAAAIDRAGGPEVITLHTVPVPQPAADEVLIAVDTAGVAIWDAHLRRHPEQIKHSAFPLVLGTDGAGTVAAVGEKVKRFNVGDPVYSYSWDNPHGGFYAEYVAVPAERVGHIPQGLTLRQAGAIGTTGLTAIQGVDDALHLKAGDTVIIHGASGGVGTLAVQFAKLRGASVLATASGDDGLALIKRLGADAVVDGRHGDIARAAREFAPRGVDAVLAFAGGDSLDRCIEALRPGGRIAYPYGVTPEPKARDDTGAVIRYNAIPGPQEFERLNRAIEAVNLKVPIQAEFPLAEADKAQERVEAGHILGKIVLRVH